MPEDSGSWYKSPALNLNLGEGVSKKYKDLFKQPVQCTRLYSVHSKKIVKKSRRYNSAGVVQC